DPLGAARHIRDALAPDGTWLIVEPMAGDTVADNLNPGGRGCYPFSTLLCVPNALSQPGGYALGAQAGEAAIGRVVTDAGFTRFRRGAERAFNHDYQARPSGGPRRRDGVQQRRRAASVTGAPSLVEEGAPAPVTRPRNGSALVTLAHASSS